MSMRINEGSGASAAKRWTVSTPREKERYDQSRILKS